MINPKEFTQRDAINSLTGIKSSLGNLRKVVSLTYLLYLANKKKSSIVYAESKDSMIVLKQEYKSFIQQYLNNSEVIDKIDDNPLLTSQIESLYVGLTLMFAFGRISFENTSLSMTKERTGGIRYPKKIDFASNIMTLDLMLNADSEESVKATLLAWLQDKQLDNKIEQRISIFLNICIENNLFKLRHGEDDLYFQTEGIYKSLITGDEVSLESDEIVGPTRILNSMLRENLVPWLNFKKSLVTINADNDFNVKEYSDIISTSLSIRDIKVDNNVENTPKGENADKEDKQLPLQQIYYGAPGTGKSHKIKEQEGNFSDVIRTTFHPDSDYSTFVGCYKPTTTNKEQKYSRDELIAKLSKLKTLGTNYPCHKFSAQYWESLKDLTSTDMKAILSACGFTENMYIEILKGIAIGEEFSKRAENQKIVYSFVAQAFTKAYIEAWKKYDVEGDKPVLLVIEEINRGNCAQIFGDLFQLLDRNKEGFSEYPIKPDSDLSVYIAGELKDYEDVPEEIRNGEDLRLPNNLYIWATMNTSDQSLFPVDSAFKRRWEWKYIKIKEGKDKDGNKLDWKIEIKDEDEQVKLTQDWWAFIQKINTIIASMTSSADKQLGYFFCKADKDGVINGETFVSKVIFYLWNDVFKDYGFEDASLFRYKAKEGGKEVEKDLTFPNFYDEDGEKVDSERLVDFIQKVMDWQKPEDNA